MHGSVAGAAPQGLGQRAGSRAMRELRAAARPFPDVPVVVLSHLPCGLAKDAGEPIQGRIKGAVYWELAASTLPGRNLSPRGRSSYALRTGSEVPGHVVAIGKPTCRKGQLRLTASHSSENAKGPTRQDSHILADARLKADGLAAAVVADDPQHSGHMPKRVEGNVAVAAAHRENPPWIGSEDSRRHGSKGLIKCDENGAGAIRTHPVRCPGQRFAVPVNGTPANTSNLVVGEIRNIVSGCP